MITKKIPATFKMKRYSYLSRKNEAHSYIMCQIIVDNRMLDSDMDSSMITNKVQVID